KVLGLSRMSFHGVNHPIAITDLPLEPDAPQGGAHEIGVDNLSFAPQALSVPRGTTVTWGNHRDIPHLVRSTHPVFKSPALDTEQQCSYRFDTGGIYKYFCALHPKMTGQVIVA